MATNKKGRAEAKLSWSLFHNRKRGVEAWWGFLAAAIIVIVVVIVLLLMFGKIKVGGDSAIGGITQQLGGMFK